MRHARSTPSFLAVIALNSRGMWPCGAAPVGQGSRGNIANVGLTLGMPVARTNNWSVHTYQCSVENRAYMDAIDRYCLIICFKTMKNVTQFYSRNFHKRRKATKHAILKLPM